MRCPESLKGTSHPLSLGWVRRRGPGGVRRRANRAVPGLVGAEQDFLASEPLVVFVHDDDRSAFRGQLARLPEKGRVDDWDVRLKPWDGVPLIVSITAAGRRNLPESVDPGTEGTEVCRGSHLRPSL